MGMNYEAWLTLGLKFKSDFEQFAKWGEICLGTFSFLCTCSSSKIRSLLRWKY